MAETKRITGFAGWWQRWRSHYWRALATDVILLLIAFWLIHAWQTRDLPRGLAPESFVHETMLRPLGGGEQKALVRDGGQGVIYFFAPWCFYCKTSIGNLDGLRESGEIAWAHAVALDFQSEDEVSQFVSDADISMPVLLGTAQTARDWSIRAFPTYFVIDSDGTIASRSVGYSTWLGLRLRTLSP